MGCIGFKGERRRWGVADATFRSSYIYTTPLSPSHSQTNCAQTLLSHLTSKKYEKNYGTVSPDAITVLEQSAEREKLARKGAGKRKLSEFLEKHNSKQLRFSDFAAESGNADTLYKIVPATKADQLDKIACHACQTFYPTSGFISHLTTAQHREGLAASRFDEDDHFIESVREVCVQSSRHAQKVRHCDLCNKDIVETAWEQHAQGKQHRHKAGLAEPSADDAEFNGYRKKPFRDETGRLPNADLDASDLWFPSRVPLGEVAKACGKGTLERFTADTVPVFFAGEEIWETDPSFYKSVQWGILNGVSCEMLETDSQYYGTNVTPALGPTLVKDRDADTYGVCITMTTEAVREMIKQKNKMVAKCACFSPGGGSPHDAIFFEMHKKPEVNVRTMVWKRCCTLGCPLQECGISCPTLLSAIFSSKNRLERSSRLRFVLPPVIFRCQYCIPNTLLY